MGPPGSLNRAYREAGGPTATLWEIRRGGHPGGICATPAEYERQVTGLFDCARA